MKRIIAATLVAAVVIGGLTLIPSAAHAATVQPGPSPSQVSAGTASGPFTTNVPDLRAAVAKADREYQARYGSSGPLGASSVSVGWGTVLLTLDHAEVVDGATKAWFAPASAVELYLCGALDGIPIIGVPLALGCMIAVAFQFQTISNLLTQAATHVTYNSSGGPPYWCPSQIPAWTGPSWCPAGLLPGAFYNWFTGDWEYPVTDSGLNLLFAWSGALLAWQINEFTG